MSEGPGGEVNIESKTSLKDKFRNFANKFTTSLSSKEPSNPSRREFLKRSAIVIGATAILSQIPGEGKNIESEPKIVAQTVIVDIMSNETTPKIPRYPTLEEFTNEVRPKSPLTTSSDTQNYLLSNSNTLQNKFGDKFYASALFTILMNEKKDHGTKIADAFKKSEAFYGNTETPVLYPLQKAYQNINARPFTEKGNGWENHCLEVTLTADAIIPLLQEAKKGSNSKHTVFNLSWQLGNQEIVFGHPDIESPRVLTQWTNINGPNNEPLFYVFPDPEYGFLDGEKKVVNGKTYLIFPTADQEILTKKYYTFIDGNPAIEAKPRIEAEKIFDELEWLSEQNLKNSGKDPITNIQTREAYRPETVQKNIQEVIKLAKSFPNDFLVLAAGNQKDDLRNIPELPNNVIIVGEWQQGNIKPTGLVYGAEIYVPNSKLGLGRGSSFSVPFITATIKELLDKGIPFNEVKIKLQANLSNKKEYMARTEGDPNSSLEVANLLDVTKLQQQTQFSF